MNKLLVNRINNKILRRSIRSVVHISGLSVLCKQTGRSVVLVRFRIGDSELVDSKAVAVLNSNRKDLLEHNGF